MVEFAVRDAFKEILGREIPHAFALGREMTLDVVEDVPQVVSGEFGILDLVVTRLVLEALVVGDGNPIRLRVSWKDGETTALLFSMSFRRRQGVGGETEDERQVRDGLFAAVRSVLSRLLESVGGSFDWEKGARGDDQISVGLPVRALVGRSILQGLLDGPLLAHGVKVLLAHEDPERRTRIRLALEDAGFVVTEVDHGFTALATLQQTHAQNVDYDVCLVSDRLPGMGGAALASAIRSDPDTGSPAVVVLLPEGAKGRVERKQGARIRFLPETVRTQRLLLAVQYAISHDRKSGTSKLHRRSVITESVPLHAAPEQGGTAFVGRDDKERGAKKTVKMAPPVDLALLHEMTQGDEGLIRELAGIFLEELAEQRRELEASLSSLDTDAARRQAHTIKGAAANFGAEPLRRLAAELESHAKQGQLPEVNRRLGELDETIRSTETWLREALGLERNGSE